VVRRVNIDPNLLDDLEWRGLIAHSTDRDALRQALTEESVRFYVGFDPTAPSLHMGNLTRRTPWSAAPPA
jgi:tyrosyl-tRNA synthetase